MCGISGFNWCDTELIREMDNRLKHRGPDGEGTYVDDHVSLGHRRLAIIDLSENGRQPMSNEDESVWITYNGEVYNFRELRVDLEVKGHRFKSKTDTETLVHAYEEYGSDFVNKLDGMFAFCIYDSRKRMLFLCRDRLGIKPLYYYWDGSRFIFSSEIKGILEHPIERRINPIVLNEFMSMRYISHQETIFKNIYRMLPGELMSFSLEEKKLNRSFYWDTGGIDEVCVGWNDAKNVIEKRLSDAVNKQLIADVPVGVFLSGGIDSSAVTAFIRSLDKDREIKTFSIAFEHGDQVNELPYAKTVSDLLNTKHREFMIGPSSFQDIRKIVSSFDEPMADPASIPLYHLSKKTSKYVKVVLVGDGADELFAGYDQHRFIGLHSRIRKIMPQRLRSLGAYLVRLTPSMVFKQMYKYYDDLGERGRERIEELLELDNNFDVYFNLYQAFTDTERREVLGGSFRELDFLRERKHLFSDMNQVLRYDIKYLLAEGYLMKTDKMTMAHSLEARVPFLDHELVEFVLGLPYSFKYNRRMTKFILRDILKKHLPKEIVSRKKQTFHVPIDRWIQYDLKDDFGGILSRENVGEHGLFSYKYIEKVFDRFNRSPFYYARQLWNLATFQIWYEEYMIEYDPG
ncbi:MAG: asparagine synthase (glutamine-hydrolyzing) [Candidatus Altiarchaeota archaeon]|nr:asparagine synthase (glutamine-hydrolyzing) [Candidatus Altiarchaeota archaeon]